MTLIILIIIILCIISLIGGIFIGISYTVNELFKHTPTPTNTQELYNKFLEKQVKI